MNIIKKLMILILIFSLCIVSNVSYAALDTLVALIDSASGQLNVSGTLACTVGNGELMLTVTDSTSDENLILVDYTRTKLEEDGIVRFVFDTQQLPLDLATGEYIISVSGEDLSEPLIDTKQYNNPKTVLNAIKRLKQACEDTTKNKDQVLCNSFGIESINIGVTVEEFASISDSAEGVEAFAKIFRDNIDFGTIPDDNAAGTAISTYNEQVKTNISNVADMSKKVALFVSINDQNDSTTWLSTYYDELGFNDFIGNTPENMQDKTKVTFYVNKHKTNSGFVNKLKKATGVPDDGMIKKIIYEAALLTEIESGTASDVGDIFKNFESFFDGIEIEAFNSLKSGTQSIILGKIAGENYDTCALATIAFNDAISEYKNGNSGGGLSGGSSSGGSKGGGSGSSVAVSTASLPTNEEKTNTIFLDITKDMWAAESISYLSEHGIINGRPDGTFGPDDNVTRAELVTMVIKAMGIPLKNPKDSFVDVKSNEWYSSYLATGVDYGLIYGNDFGYFNPNDSISRQDICVILMRAIGEENITDLKINFFDANDISDYAKSAVAYWSSINVIKGKEDGLFYPKHSATRAETAAIIHRAMTLNNKK